MPAPITVTRDQVAEAAAMLRSAGEPVTGWRLRRIIGSGRPDRLEVLANEIAAEEVVPDAQPFVLPVLPPALTDHLAASEGRLVNELRGLVGEAWRLAVDMVERRVEQEVVDARARVEALEAEMALAALMLERADERAAELEAERDAAERATSTAEMKHRGAEKAADDANTILFELRTSMAAVEARAKAADDRLAAMIAVLGQSAGAVRGDPTEAAPVAK